MAQPRLAAGDLDQIARCDTADPEYRRGVAKRMGISIMAVPQLRAAK
jgi:hypothetical protein